VDPARVAALADQVLLPGERHRAGVDRLARLAELLGAGNRESDVVVRGPPQRLLARGPAVAAEPRGGGLGPLDDPEADRPQPQKLVGGGGGGWAWGSAARGRGPRRAGC